MKACWRGQHMHRFGRECVNVIVIKLSMVYSVYKQGDHNERHETGFGDMMWDSGGGSTRPAQRDRSTIDSACPSRYYYYN